jgi:hypothetical protein
MRFAPFAAALVALTLTACGKPTAPDSPDPSAYGTVIKQDHHIPEKDRDADQKPAEQKP